MTDARRGEEIAARMAYLRARDEHIRWLREHLATAESLAADPGPVDPDQDDWGAGPRNEVTRRRARAVADHLRASLEKLLP
jgi:hypothetical protein